MRPTGLREPRGSRSRTPDSLARRVLSAGRVAGPGAVRDVSGGRQTLSLSVSIRAYKIADAKVDSADSPPISTLLLHALSREEIVPDESGPPLRL